MGQKYKPEENPFSDLLYRILKDYDSVNRKVVEKLLYNSCYEFLVTVYQNEDYFDYLDFTIKIKDKGKYVKLVANNIVTALWFSGYFVFDVDSVFTNNSCIIGEIEHTFDYKKKCLTAVK